MRGDVVGFPYEKCPVCGHEELETGPPDGLDLINPVNIAGGVVGGVLRLGRFLSKKLR